MAELASNTVSIYSTSELSARGTLGMSSCLVRRGQRWGSGSVPSCATIVLSACQRPRHSSYNREQRQRSQSSQHAAGLALKETFKNLTTLSWSCTLAGWGDTVELWRKGVFWTLKEVVRYLSVVVLWKEDSVFKGNSNGRLPMWGPAQEDKSCRRGKEYEMWTAPTRSLSYHDRFRELER